MLVHHTGGFAETRCHEYCRTVGLLLRVADDVELVFCQTHQHDFAADLALPETSSHGSYGQDFW